MIKNFEYKIPFNLKRSFEIILKCGNEIPMWKLIRSDEQAGIVEWKQKFWSILGFSKIRVHLKEPRPSNTLVTISVYRPFQIIDPAKMCERVYKKLEVKLNKKALK
jgi:hypothetical protein